MSETQTLNLAQRIDALPRLSFILNTPVLDVFTKEVPAGYRHRVEKPIVCTDGARISVQASAGHYCSPRLNSSCWYSALEAATEFEVPEWAEWLEDAQPEHKFWMYAFLPTEHVVAFIEAHGGEAS